MKTFLLFRYSEWSEKHGANLVLPECCVLANSDKEAAVKTGGHLESRLIRNEATKVVVFPKSLFESTKVDNKPSEPEEIFEYQKGSLSLIILPEEKELVLPIVEIPLV